MGRGLSDLQKTILVTALKSLGEEVGVDITHKHIHQAFYGDVDRTGATRVAISRAMERLADRGLIELWAGLYRSGGNLTAEGKVVAEKLTINKVTTCHFVNQ